MVLLGLNSMTRQAHWLKPNKKVEIPTHCIYYDTETRSHDRGDGIEEARLWFGWACYTRRYRGQTWGEPTWCRFTTTSGFVRWLAQYIKPKRKLYLFAHNTGFDFTVLKGFDWIRRTGWKSTGRIVDDPPTVLRFRRDSTTLCFLDTLNYFRMPLKEVGAFVGTSKLDMPVGSENLEAWDVYCKADVQILVDAMQAFWRMVYDNELGSFTYTMASQAFAAFRHRFMNVGVFIDDNVFANELSRKAYVGGRTECFRLGRIEEPLHCVDINSQYPYVMSNTEVPTRLLTTLSNTDIRDLKEACASYAVVAEVTITTEIARYPKKIPGWTIFPVGTFQTSLNTPELLLALQNGEVAEVHSMAVYDKAILFKEYVDFFYNKRLDAREQGLDVLSGLYKLMMNSLYGKFGQNGRKYELVWGVSNDDIRTWAEWDVDGQTLHKYRQFAGLVEELQKEAESRESFPAIAGHIASAARVLLLSFIHKSGALNTVYCDTDSLFVTNTGLDNLETSMDETKLGYLKKEWSSTDVTIHGVKDYEIGDKLKRKGIRHDAETLSPSSYRQVQFRGMKGMIQDGDLSHLLIRHVTKNLHRVYSKGVVAPNGIIHPLEFPLQEFPDL